jgi:hypothetical protein
MYLSPSCATSLAALGAQLLFGEDCMKGFDNRACGIGRALHHALLGYKKTGFDALDTRPHVAL